MAKEREKPEKRKRAEEGLRERVKELTCLYAVHRDMHEDLSTDELCNRAIEHLVPAMQFPEITIPVIEVDDRRFASKRYTEGLSHGLHAEIRVGGETCGQLSVYYTEERPFLIPEEQNLLDAIAEALGLWLERKRAEEALRQSEERYRRIVETAHEGIWIIDSESKTIFANSRMTEMLGYTTDEMMGKSLFDFMDEEWQAIAQVNVDRRRRGVTEQHDFKFRRKDGTDLWAIVTTNPFFDEDGRYTSALGMITDITERKWVEEKVRESEKKYRTLYETIRDGIAGGHMDGRILECNQAFADMLGYSKDELKNLTYQQITPKRWHQMEAEIVEEQILKRGYSDEYEKEYIRKDGTVFPISARVWLVRG